MKYQDSFENNTPKKATVIGAGLAGLTAAYRLQQAGYQVNVYEARERPGGRVHTIPIGNSYAELGGQSLKDGGEAKTIRNLIHEMNLSLETAWEDRTYSYSTIFGKHLEDASKLIADMPEADATLWNTLVSISEQSKNISEVLDRLLIGKNPNLRVYFERFMQGYEGLDTQDLSIIYISSLFNFIKLFRERMIAYLQGNPQKFSLEHVKGGNSRLVEALASKLQGCIHYHSILKKMTKKNGLIQLHFNSDKIVETDCVILALPCSTLREVEIEDEIFPSDQLKAIRTLKYGTNSKLLVPIHFSARPQPEFIGTRHFMSWFNHDYSVLVLYYGGSAGIFRTDTQEKVSSKYFEELPYLKLAYPKADFPKNTSPIGINWSNEEFSKGSYSVLGVQQENLFQNFIEIAGENIRVVFRPINNQIFFAGEHTSVDYPATLQGAVDSGEKVSRMIMSIKS